MNTVFVVLTEEGRSLVRLVSNEQEANKVKDDWNERAEMHGREKVVVQRWAIWDEA